jgi:hypothetical protein
MDWIALLEDHHVPYVTSGPNTKKGEVSVKCPWCGPDDPSEHLGIKLEGEAWGCHRNQQHRGKGPKKLVQALLGCSFNQARLVVEQYNQADPDSLADAIFEQKEAPVKAVQRLKLPAEAYPIPPKGRFIDYIRSRGFDSPALVANRYGLKCCTVGRWKDRILIPVFNEYSQLIAWTARAIMRPVSAPRYLSSSDVIKTTLFDIDSLYGGDVLFVTEGPMDAIKVDYYSSMRNCRATAVFGTSITPAQISLLSKVAKRFKKTVILLDTDAIESAFNLSDWLPNAVVGQLPDGVKDPGDLTKDQVVALVNSYKN